MQLNGELIGGLFESSWSWKVDNSQKVTSIDQNNKNVYVGYQNGCIDIFQININGFKLDRIKSQQQTKNKRFFSKNSIDQLKEFNSYLLVVSEGYLLCVDGETLDNVGTIVEKNCVMVTVNETQQERILALTKKKEVLIFDFEDAPFGFRQLDRKLYLSEIPPTLVFFNDKIFYTTFRKEYFSLDINSTSEAKVLKDFPKNTQQAFIKIINLKEMFVVAPNNIGIFLTLEGQLKQKSTIQLDPQKIILNIHIIDMYMIVFYEDDCCLVQQMDIGDRLNEGVVKFVTHSQNYQVVYFGSQTEIRNLYMVSFEDQISQLLTECKIDKALQIFNMHYSKTNCLRQQRLEEFNIDACWCLLHFGKFDEAYKIIEDNIRYDIRQFMDSFTNDDDINNVIAKIKKNMLTANITSDRKTIASATLKNTHKEYRDNILNFLIKLCIKDREHYLKFLTNKTQTFEFYLSNHSTKFYTTMRDRHKYSYTDNIISHENYLKLKKLNSSQSSENNNSSELDLKKSYTSTVKMDEVENNVHLPSEMELRFDENTTAKQMLEQIDYYLIKYLIMSNNENDLITVLSQNTNHCRDRYDDLLLSLQALMSVGPRHNQVLSRFYEYFQNYTQALLLWQECMEDPALIQECCDNISRILKNFPKEKLIIDFFPLVMQHKPDKAIEVFSVFDPQKFPPSQVKQLITETKDLTAEVRNNLTGMYYEVISIKYNYIDSNIHNALADYYIRYIFSNYSKENDYFQFLKDLRLANSKNAVISSELVKKYNAFDSFLRNPAMLYDPNFVLKLIHDSYLQNQIIFLLCRLDQHEKALRILIQQGDHDTAQIECNKEQSKLLPILFKIYLEKYNELIAEGSNSFVSSNQRKSQAIRPKSQSRAQERNNYNLQKLYKDYLDDILYKYSYYKDLDPVDILNLIPDDWVLASSQIFNPLVLNKEEDQVTSNTRGKEDSLDKSLEEENTALFEFLTQALSETLYTQRQMKCTKFASESQLLEKKLKVISCKKAYISQYNDRKCSACNKSITDTTIFVVYPNGVLAHQSCVSKTLNICPETGQDFVKTFKY